MAKFFGSLADTLAGSALTRILKRLGLARTPVRLEVEGTEASFFTVLAVRTGMVVLSKPTDLPEGLLTQGGWVRFVIPEGGREVVRMRISNPNFRRSRGDYVFLCDMPEQFSGQSKRESDRYNTSRFNNLYLQLPQAQEPFRIIDISRTGCKIYIGGEELPEELGAELQSCKVMVGSKKVEIGLDACFLRVVHPPIAGFEWKVSSQGPALKFLAHLLKSLYDAEFGRLKIKEGSADSSSSV